MGYLKLNTHSLRNALTLEWKEYMEKLHYRLMRLIVLLLNNERRQELHRTVGNLLQPTTRLRYCR